MNKGKLNEKTMAKIWIVVLAILSIGCFIFSIVAMIRNDALRSFDSIQGEYSEPNIVFSSGVTEVLQLGDDDSYTKDLEQFVSDFYENTGIPVLLNFMTIEDLNLDAKKIKDDADIVEYYQEHYEDFTGGKQDYLCVMVCFADETNTYISFVPGDLVLIDYNAVDEFYKVYNRLLTSNNYKFTFDILIKSLKSFESVLSYDMMLESEDGRNVGVYKDASMMTPEQLEGISSKYILYDLDDNAEKVLGIDHQVYYDYADKLVPRPVIIGIIVLSFMLCAATILLIIKYYGEYGSKIHVRV